LQLVKRRGLQRQFEGHEHRGFEADLENVGSDDSKDDVAPEDADLVSSVQTYHAGLDVVFARFLVGINAYDSRLTLVVAATGRPIVQIKSGQAIAEI